jgi:hypothetical protein
MNTQKRVNERLQNLNDAFDRAIARLKNQLQR